MAQMHNNMTNNITIVGQFAPPVVWIYWIHAAGGAVGLLHDFSDAAIEAI